MDNRTIKHHQLFPSIQESRFSPNLVFSHHLPIAYYIQDEPSLKILSWNVYKEGLPFGFDLSEQSYFGNHGERHKRICAALNKFIDNLNITIFALQEVSTDLLKLLQATFDNSEWVILSNLSLVTICKKALVTTIHTSDIHTQTVELLLNKKTIILTNAHLIEATFPNKTEKIITEKLSQKAASINIIVGTLNACVAPTHDHEINIITSLTPPSCAKRINWVDGGFIQYKDSDIKQLEQHILNPSSGKDYQVHTETLIAHHKDYFQMHICLDKKHTSQKLFGEQTLLEYETELREKFKDDGILLRLASNCYNHKLIAIKLSVELKNVGFEICEILQKILPDDKKLLTIPLNPNSIILCVPMDSGIYLKNTINIAKIIKAINTYEFLRNDKIALFSKIFDSSRGKIRANTFKSLIITYHNNPLIIDILTLAVLINQNGTQLQIRVYTQLGYTSLDQACIALTDKINKQLATSTANNQHNAELFAVIKEIVSTLNSKKTIESPEVQNALQLLNQIIPHQQPDKIIKCL